MEEISGSALSGGQNIFLQSLLFHVRPSAFSEIDKYYYASKKIEDL
jgi:hypothetical protein